jgi:hypothetical protein
MKLCKDCKFCESPGDSGSLCTHYKSKYWKSFQCTDIVTGEQQGQDEFSYHGCTFMRDGILYEGKCGSKAKLFRPRIPEAKKLNWFQKLFNKSS